MTDQNIPLRANKGANAGGSAGDNQLLLNALNGQGAQDNQLSDAFGAGPSLVDQFADQAAKNYAKVAEGIKERGNERLHIEETTKNAKNLTSNAPSKIIQHFFGVDMNNEVDPA